MKKAIVALVLVCLPLLAFAHPPKSVDVSWDAASQTLTMTVTHLIKSSSVTDPVKHRVKDVAVVVNGKPALDAAYSYQEFDNGETAAYKLNLKSGDKVTVTAACSLAGSKSTDLTVK